LSRGEISWSTPVTPWTSALEDWSAITAHLVRNSWVQYHVAPSTSLRLYTDSSLSGWAWLIVDPQDTCLLGFRGGWASGPHINVLELLTVWKALHWLLPRLPGFTWEIFCDNTTVVHQLRRGRTADYNVNLVLSDLAYLLQHTGSQVRPIWVSTHDQLADEHTRLLLRVGDSPESFGAIPIAQPLCSQQWPAFLRTFLRTTATPSTDAPLGFLPTGI
jgi:hypothetical protein